MEEGRIIYINSVECVCPVYRGQIMRCCSYQLSNGYEFGIIIDDDDHEGNGVIMITDMESLVKILGGYHRLCSEYHCTCLMCSVIDNL